MTPSGRLARLAVLLAVVGGCAHVEPPPGGPEDAEPPRLLTTRPDSLAVQPGFTGPVVLVFDERISERGLDDLVLVSPRTSPVRVDHRRDELRVSLRGGWQPGTIYHVTVLPDVQDLFGNRRREPLSFVFSTGPEIPETHASGRVVDRITGRRAAGMRVEAIRLADSLVYATVTDTAGAYRFHRVPTGEYLMRAYEDMNRDRALDEFEPRDSALVTITPGDTATASLAILLPDTTPPNITAVAVDERVVEVTFDDHLDPAQPLDVERISVVGPAGERVPVVAAAIGGAPGPVAAADTVTPPTTDPPTAEASPLPSRSLFLRLAEAPALQAGGEYRLTIRGVRNVNGLVADVERAFSVPEAPPPEPAGVSR